jgi:hypothetical protein
MLDVRAARRLAQALAAHLDAEEARAPHEGALVDSARARPAVASSPSAASLTLSTEVRARTTCFTHPTWITEHKNHKTNGAGLRLYTVSVTLTVRARGWFTSGTTLAKLPTVPALSHERPVPVHHTHRPLISA